jgi:hypothetical protein
MDPATDTDPAIFVVFDLQDVPKKFLGLTPYFLKVHLHHFSKIKSHKEVTKQKESMFDHKPDPGGPKT